jgi:putative SOS response-associated peptidase YedK
MHLASGVAEYMCGRFTLHTERELLARRFEVKLEGVEDLAPRYNIAPAQSILTVRRHDDSRLAEMMLWGLVPAWAKDRSKLPKMINARVETAATKPAYRGSFRRQRCLILADGFYEWQAHPGPMRGKTPYWISLESGEPFAMAGLWAEWRPPDPPGAEPLRSCTILTAPANAAVVSLHDRMPVVLRREAEEAWLDPALDGQSAALRELLTPIPGDVLRSRPVSRRVNSTRNDGPELIQPSDDPSLGFT